MLDVKRWDAMSNGIRTKRGSADALHAPEAGAPLRGVARFVDVMHPTTFRQTLSARFRQTFSVQYSASNYLSAIHMLSRSTPHSPPL
jgi:hypothetical protein